MVRKFVHKFTAATSILAYVISFDMHHDNKSHFFSVLFVSVPEVSAEANEFSLLFPHFVVSECKTHWATPNNFVDKAKIVP